MKRILITGGAGFIGSHLCRELVNRGEYVICLDNYFTGSISNIKDLSERKNFELVEHDITVPYEIEVDQIYNLACPASPIHYQYDAIKTIKTCFLGSLHTLGIAKKCGARILQASTSEVYGNPEIHPQPESYWGKVNPIGVRSCYDEGKRAAETLFFDYHRKHNIDIRVVRIFNTYGPGMSINDGRVISNFIVQALKGENITVVGDGCQTRCFCYVSELVRAMIDIMNYEDSGFTGPVNIGNPEEYTMLELADLIIKLTNSKSKIIFNELPQDDPTRRKPLTDLARNTINWMPKVELREGLEKTIAYFREFV